MGFRLALVQPASHHHHHLYHHDHLLRHRHCHQHHHRRAITSIIIITVGASQNVKMRPCCCHINSHFLMSKWFHHVYMVVQFDTNLIRVVQLIRMVVELLVSSIDFCLLGLVGACVRGLVVPITSSSCIIDIKKKRSNDRY